jgi:hypothetical protein
MQLGAYGRSPRRGFNRGQPTSFSLLLFDAEVAFRRLNGGMPQGNLDLLERGMAFVRQFGEGPPEIMGRDPLLFDLRRACYLAEILDYSDFVTVEIVLAIQGVTPVGGDGETLREFRRRFGKRSHDRYFA